MVLYGASPSERYTHRHTLTHTHVWQRYSQGNKRNQTETAFSVSLNASVLMPTLDASVERMQQQQQGHDAAAARPPCEPQSQSIPHTTQKC